jgi:hypothetical protein
MDGATPRGRSMLAAFLTATAVVACGPGDTESPAPSIGSADFVFPTHPAWLDGPAAQLTGTVEVVEGCIYVQARSRSRYLVVWPASMSLRVDNQGQPVVELAGRHVAAPGEVIELTGGETDNPVGARCPGKAWHATGLSGEPGG